MSSSAVAKAAAAFFRGLLNGFRYCAAAGLRAKSDGINETNGAKLNQ
jgi:hypothetical protein